MDKDSIKEMEKLGFEFKKEHWFDEEAVEGTQVYYKGEKIIHLYGHDDEMEEPETSDYIRLLKALGEKQ